VAFLPLPIVLFVLPRAARRLSQATRRQRRKQGSSAARAAESLRQIRLVKAYTAEERVTQEFSRDSSSGESAAVQAARISAQMERNTDIVTGIGLALVLFFGAHRVLTHAITVGDLVVFLSYARSFYRPVGNVSNSAVRMGRVSAAAERMLQVLQTPPEDRSTGRPAPSFRGQISFDGVRYTYPEGAEALAGVSFEVPAGALAALVGPNGAGKSTILSILLRLITPDEGEVRIDGEPINALKLSSYRSRFAYVPQPVELFSGTLRENILYGRLDATEDQVRAAAEEALLDDVVDRLPGGFDAPLGEGGETLSGGEARRLMLARAAVRDARVLLLDEPLAGLDPEAREVVARALRQIGAGRTTIVVSHEAVSDIDPDAVVALDAGRLVEATERPLEEAGTHNAMGSGKQILAG
jgi:ATP-binding cassette, subfamily B, bacterial